MLKYYFPFYKKKFCFSAGSLIFPYSQPLEIPRKMGFGGVPLKQHIGENAKKLVKTGPKNGPDFFTHTYKYFKEINFFPYYLCMTKVKKSYA